jgi:hypothetical protein
MVVSLAALTSDPKSYCPLFGRGARELNADDRHPAPLAGELHRLVLTLLHVTVSSLLVDLVGRTCNSHTLLQFAYRLFLQPLCPRTRRQLHPRCEQI